MECEKKNRKIKLTGFIGVCECENGFEPDPSFALQCRRCFKPSLEAVLESKRLKRDIDRIWPD